MHRPVRHERTPAHQYHIGGSSAGGQERGKTLGGVGTRFAFASLRGGAGGASPPLPLPLCRCVALADRVSDRPVHPQLVDTHDEQVFGEHSLMLLHFVQHGVHRALLPSEELFAPAPLPFLPTPPPFLYCVFFWKWTEEGSH